MDIKKTQQNSSKVLPLETKTYQGIYGAYTITQEDQSEVKRYRMSLLVCGISFSTCLFQWIYLGPNQAFLWLAPIAISIGLALQWIHIYLRPLHNALKIFWVLGCLGGFLLLAYVGPHKMLSSLVTQPGFIWFIGPMFAALTGIGFKEFFCFRRLEAIGLTLLLPGAILGYLVGLFTGEIAMTMLIFAGLLLTVLAIRKFGMDPSSDVGDKSIFNYLDQQQAENIL